MRRITSIILLAIVAAAPQLLGGYNAYLWIEGIEGDSLAKERKGWIDITSVSHGVTQLGGGASQHADVVLIKSLDSASPLLNLHCASGLVIPEAIVDFVRQDETSTRFYRLFLKNVTISLVQLQGVAGGEVPLEVLGLNFGYIEWTYTEFAGTGEALGEHIAYWDLAKATGGINSPDDPPPPSGDLGFRASLQVLDGSEGTATLSWTSAVGKDYGIYYSPTLDGPFDQLVATVSSTGDGITSTTVDLVGNRGFFVIRELD